MGMMITAPVGSIGKRASGTRLRSDDPLLEGYFSEEPFLRHSSVSWLLSQLNLSHPGMEAVSAAHETKDEFKVRRMHGKALRNQL